jgi:ribosomal protein S18 acetylase RimI-like enzyme
VPQYRRACECASSGARTASACEFWVACGIRIRPGDNDGSLAAFATLNPGLFLLAENADRIAGSALGGWDGRRGWLFHVAVHPDARWTEVNLIAWHDNAGAMLLWEDVGSVREKTVDHGKLLT